MSPRPRGIHALSHYTPSEAAELLGVTPAAVFRLMRTGSLPTETFLRRQKIPAWAVAQRIQALREEPPAPTPREAAWDTFTAALGGRDEAAQRLGCSSSTLRKWRAGEAVPGAQLAPNVRMLAEIVDVPCPIQEVPK